MNNRDWKNHCRWGGLNWVLGIVFFIVCSMFQVVFWKSVVLWALLYAGLCCWLLPTWYDE